MTKTEHYHLNQWDAADPVRSEDFNADNAAVDAALKAIRDTVGALIVTGAYTGTAETATAKQTITLGFQPRFLLVIRAVLYINANVTSANDWNTTNFGVALPGHNHCYAHKTTVLEITGDGFIAGGTGAFFNASSETYIYLAVR